MPKTPITRFALDKNPMPGLFFEGNPVDEGQREGALTLPGLESSGISVGSQVSRNRLRSILANAVILGTHETEELRFFCVRYS